MLPHRLGCGRPSKISRCSRFPLRASSAQNPPISLAKHHQGDVTQPSPSFASLRRPPPIVSLHLRFRSCFRFMLDDLEQLAGSRDGHSLAAARCSSCTMRRWTLQLPRALMNAATTVALCGGLVACGNAGEALSLTLSDGAQLEVSDEGAIRIIVGDEVVFATQPGVPFEVRRFDESSSGPFAIWLFERENVRTIQLSRYQGATPLSDGSGAIVRYESEDGELVGSFKVTTGEFLGTTQLSLEVSGGSANAVAVPVACDEQASFYGFGEQYNASDQRGEAFGLLVGEQGIGRDPALSPGGVNGGPHTSYFPMPYYLDARGFGLLLETEQRVEVDLCKSDPAVAWLGDSECRAAVDDGVSRACAAGCGGPAGRQSGASQGAARLGVSVVDWCAGWQRRTARESGCTGGGEHSGGGVVGAGLDRTAPKPRGRQRRAVPLAAR